MSFSVEPLAAIDVANLASWIKAIDFAAWPQQHKIDHQLRPAMVSDPEWFGFKANADPVIGELMAHFPGCAEHTRLLSVVMPGHDIIPHVDHQNPDWICRVHVPLTTNDRSFFIVGDHSYWMTVGQAYKVNTRIEHSVVNNGPEPRIHLMFDVRK